MLRTFVTTGYFFKAHIGAVSDKFLCAISQTIFTPPKCLANSLDASTIEVIMSSPSLINLHSAEVFPFKVILSLS